MKKIIVLLLCAAVIVCLCASFAGCYISKPDTMEHLVGTYRLESYTRTPKNSDSETETQSIDMIKDKGITAYLIVKSDGTGYYAYKDDSTPAYARSINIEYTYDGEKSDSVEKIRYDDGYDHTGDGYPGKGYEVLGLNFTKREKKLSFTMPAVFKRDYSQSVRYEKVSDTTDLSYVSEKMGGNLKATEFGLNGLSTLSAYDKTDCVYFIYDIRATEKKADLYYALKSDEVPHVERDLTVSWKKEKNQDNIDVIHVTIGDITYTRYIPMTNYLFYYEPATETTEAVSIGLTRTTDSIQTVIAQKTAEWEEEKRYLNENAQ